MEDDDAIDELVRTNRQKVSGRLTASGNGQGTPFNMSPEQVRETSDVDHRTDIYNMGIVLFEILTDESHMSGRNFREIKHKILKDPAQTPAAHAARAAISPELNAICEKALQKEPVDCYLKMSEFVDDLRAVLLGRSVSSYQPTNSLSDSGVAKQKVMLRPFNDLVTTGNPRLPRDPVCRRGSSTLSMFSLGGSGQIISICSACRGLSKDFLGQAGVVDCSGTPGSVIEDALAETGRLCELNVSANFCAKDLSVRPWGIRITLFQKVSQVFCDICRQASTRFVQTQCYSRDFELTVESSAHQCCGFKQFR